MTCPECGQQNPDGFRFCGACGSAFATAVGAATREERKRISVLFCDLVGFTGRAEAMDPEEVRALLQPYHARVREELERYGGTVEKFIGDAVVALFGAPTAHEDDPERAVRAGLAIRDAVAGDDLHIRIGITTGEALVALDARPESGEGMASGDVVNTAARLQAAAPVDGILVDEATYRATQRAIDYRDHPPIEAKGKAAPVAVHEALVARSRLGLDVGERSATPFVGRRLELDVLGTAFRRASRERIPQLLTLVGVPGMGKSRLVMELFRLTDEDPDLVRWRQGRCLPYGAGVTLWALAEIVKAQAGILETDTADEAQAKLGEAVGQAVGAGERAWVERHLRPLVGLESDGELTGERRDEAFAAWRRFFEGVADQAPLVLVIEDLQWADDALLDFLEHLVDWASDVRLLIVATARPELLARRPGWGGGTANAVNLSLAPLTDEETAALAGAVLGRGLMPVEVRDTLLANAGGNPLYAEEFARLYAERGPSQAETAVPDSVQGMIAARIDSLERSEKALIQDAAVLGKVFWLGAVEAMTGEDKGALERRLHELERREFVRRDRQSAVAGERQYAFRHLLIREVAYGQIPRARRAERHAAVARWIEALAPDRSDDRADMLAHHWTAALEYAMAAGRAGEELADRARRSLIDAGDRALALNAATAAADFFDRALAIAPDAAVTLRLGRSLYLAGDERAGTVLGEARDALAARGDAEGEAFAEAMLSHLDL
ncbi:MAG TPA: AAA family ATPase [Candidatus Limnocylindrales bacterium]|nr:AAA family ATPase [Candidatus Limnocylindrales bacterium]